MSDKDRMLGWYLSNADSGSNFSFVHSTPWITNRVVIEASAEECKWLEDCIYNNKLMPSQLLPLEKWYKAGNKN